MLVGQDVNVNWGGGVEVGGDIVAVAGIGVSVSVLVGGSTVQVVGDVGVKVGVTSGAVE